MCSAIGFGSFHLDNRDENHPMAVRVNSRDFYTALGTLPLVCAVEALTRGAAATIMRSTRAKLPRSLGLSNGPH